MEETLGKEKSTREEARREADMIDTGTDKRYVRRGAKSRFKESDKESDDVGKSLAR